MRVGDQGIRKSVVLDLTNQAVSAKQQIYICENFKLRALIELNHLRDQGCTLDVSRGSLYSGSNKVKLRNEPCWGVHRVSVAETVTPEPDRDVDLNCKMENAACEAVQGVVEALERFHERFPIAVTSTVSYVIHVIPFLLYKYSDKPVIIYKGTTVGDFCPVVGRGEILLTILCYRVEIDTYDQDGRTIVCNMLTRESETDRNVVEEPEQEPSICKEPLKLLENDIIDPSASP